MGSQVPEQESNPGPQLWKLRVLTTGPWGILDTLYSFTHMAHSFVPFSSKWLRDYKYDDHKSTSYPMKLTQNATI